MIRMLVHGYVRILKLALMTVLIAMGLLTLFGCGHGNS